MKGGKWDNCNSIINKKKKRKKMKRLINIQYIREKLVTWLSVTRYRQ